MLIVTWLVLHFTYFLQKNHKCQRNTAIQTTEMCFQKEHWNNAQSEIVSIFCVILVRLSMIILTMLTWVFINAVFCCAGKMKEATESNSGNDVSQRNPVGRFKDDRACNNESSQIHLSILQRKTGMSLMKRIFPKKKFQELQAQTCFT